MSAIEFDYLVKDLKRNIDTDELGSKLNLYIKELRKKMVTKYEFNIRSYALDIDVLKNIVKDKNNSDENSGISEKDIL